MIDNPARRVQYLEDAYNVIDELRKKVAQLQSELDAIKMTSIRFRSCPVYLRTKSDPCVKAFEDRIDSWMRQFDMHIFGEESEVRPL